MGRLDDLVAIEKGELGVQETGQNIVKYNDWYWGPSYKSDGASYPWCVVFQAWCADKTHIPFPRTAHCNGVEAFAKERGQWVAGGYRPGDFVIFDYDRDNNRDHIGLVIEDLGYGLLTIEGNYADRVQTVTRKYAEPIGAYRPQYDTAVEEDPAPPAEDEPVDVPEKEPDESGSIYMLPTLMMDDYGPAVGSLQVLLRNHGYYMSGSFTWEGKPDCEFGPETRACLMDFCGKSVVDFPVWSKLIGGLG